MKLIFAVVAVSIVVVLGIYFSGRYIQIESSVRQAEIEAKAITNVPAPKQVNP